MNTEEQAEVTKLLREGWQVVGYSTRHIDEQSLHYVLVQRRGALRSLKFFVTEDSEVDHIDTYALAEDE